MQCDFYNDGVCELASSLSGIKCPAGGDTCDACEKSIPSKQENAVTYSLAFSALHRKKLFDPKLHSHVQDGVRHFCTQKNTVPIQTMSLSSGVGTVLQRKLSWFVRKDDSCVLCRYRAAKMNEWGPDGCEDKIELILVWLQHSAKKRGVPFFKEAVRLVVQSAIKEERKNLCCKKK